MKKSIRKKIYTVASLVIILLIIAIYGVNEIYSYKDQVLLKQEIIKGANLNNIENDKLKISLKLSCDESAHAEHYNQIVLPIADKPNIESSFHQNNDERQPLVCSPSFNHFKSGGTMYTRIRGDESVKEAALDRLKIDEYDFGANWINDTVLSEMIKANEKTKTIDLKDYIDYFPIGLSNDYDFQLKNTNINIKDHPNLYETRIDDFFKLPVKKGTMLKYNVNYYDVNGEVNIDYDVKPLDKKESKKENDFNTPNFRPNTYFAVLAKSNKAENKVFVSFKSSPRYQIPEEYRGVFCTPLYLKPAENKANHHDDCYEFNSKEFQRIFIPKQKEEIMDVFSDNKDDICVLSQVEKTKYLNIIRPSLLESLKTAKAGEKEKLYEENTTIIKLEHQGEHVEKVITGSNGILVLYSKAGFDWIDDTKSEILMRGKLDRDIYERFQKEHDIYLNFSEKRRFAFYYDNSKLYILDNQHDKAVLSVVDEKETLSKVNYSFPLMLSKNQLIDPNYKVKSYYQIMDVNFDFHKTREKEE